MIKVRDIGWCSSAYADDYAFMTVFKHLAERFDTAIVLVHHTRKQESQDIMQEYIKEKEAGLLTGKEIAFADWAEKCIALRVGRVSAATYENNRYMIKHMKAYFGKKKLADPQS